LLTIIEAVVVIILEAVLFAKGIPVYLIIFIFSLIFQVALAWDAVEYQPLIQQREKKLMISLYLGL